ncbi:hypothetical protein NC651_006207 [Populus alba x Populus x berolinensis]|nr:hypothetical protein NC651_006207 [Populus alba x Populus x berolinensis]
MISSYNSIRLTAKVYNNKSIHMACNYRTEFGSGSSRLGYRLCCHELVEVADGVIVVALHSQFLSQTIGSTSPPTSLKKGLSHPNPRQ